MFWLESVVVWFIIVVYWWVVILYLLMKYSIGFSGVLVVGFGRLVESFCC